MMNEIFNSIKAYLHDKTTSPLLGALILSWLVWNYDFVFVALSSTMETSAKLAYIHEYIRPNDWEVIVRRYVPPILIALAYLFVYAYPAKWVFAYTRKRQNELREERQKIDKDRLLSVEESAALRREHVRLKVEYDSQVERLQSENKGLTSLVTELEEQIKARQKVFEGEIDDIRSEVKPIHLKILAFLTQNQNVATEEDLKDHIDAVPIEIGHAIDQLVHLGAVGTSDTAGQRTILLNVTGRTILAEFQDKLSDS